MHLLDLPTGLLEIDLYVGKHFGHAKLLGWAGALASLSRRRPGP